MPEDKLTRMKSRPDAPTEVVTIVPTTAEMPSIAQDMDPDRVIAILRAAEAGDTKNLFCLYRDVVSADNHIQAELAKRKLAVLGDLFRVLPVDAKSSVDNAASEECKTAIANIKGWRLACSHLLDSSLWPVAVVEKVFRPQGSRFVIDRLVPVPAYLLDYTSGQMRIFDVDPSSGTILASTHDADPNRYMIHRGHLLTSPDTWGGPMRSILFWWLLSTMGRGWWARFLDRFGAPFPVGKYPKGDTASRTVLADAFSLAVKIGGLVVSDETSVELIQAATSSNGEAYANFIGVCQREKSKLILGQTLSAQTDATGLGSGVADLQGDVRDDIRQFDAAMLSETIRDQLFAQICILSAISGAVPTPVWGSKSWREVKAITDTLASLKDSGISITDDSLQDLSVDFGYSLQRDVSATSTGDQDGPDKAGVAVSDNLQNLALNGAQVDALLAVFERIANGSIPQTTARAIIMSAFPSIPETLVMSMLEDMTVRPPTLQPAGDATGFAAASQRLRELPADVAQIVRSSGSEAECRLRITALCAHAPRHISAGLLAEALLLRSVLRVGG